MGGSANSHYQGLIRAVAVSMLLAGLALSASATTVQWGAGFSGFRPGDVYFLSTVRFSTSGHTRGPTLFSYSPANDEIAEIMPIKVATGYASLAFDPTGRGLFIADSLAIQLLKSDGVLIHFATPEQGASDLAITPDGTLYTAEFFSIHRYSNGSSREFVNIGTFVNGIALGVGGFVVGIWPKILGDDNLLWLDAMGAVTQRKRVGNLGILGSVEKARARADGKFVVVADDGLTLYLVAEDGTYSTFASLGSFADDMAVDTRNGLDVWVTSGSLLLKLATNGTPLHVVPGYLSALGYPGDSGYFSPSGVAVTPLMVIAASPASGAIGVPTAATVSATFNADIEPATVDARTFLLLDTVNNIVPATVSYNVATRTATLTPNSPLAEMATYTAKFVGGAGGVNDMAGYALPADVIWSFTIEQGAGPPAPTNVVSAILPVSRSAVVGSPVTVFGTIINAGASQATGCAITLSPAAPAGLTLVYQTTSPATNQVIGSPNMPVNIAPGAAQSFVVALTPSAFFAPVDMPIVFDCENSPAAPTFVGVNTLLISASTTPVPDVVALAATLSGNGIVNIPGLSATGAFAVASVNVGAASPITVSADTGGTVLPIGLTICETNPATGACLQAPAASVPTTIASGATPTFAIFVQGTGSAVPFDPAGNRVFVRFRDAGGTVRGATSVAVRTQ